jgi:hypothetical protein
MRDLPRSEKRTTVCCVWTEADLAALLSGLSENALFVDLTRQGMTPFFAAQQICGQLGQSFGRVLADLPPILLPSNGKIEAIHIGSWIDFELFGDVARIAADRVTTMAETRGYDALVVLLPAVEAELTRADGLLIGTLVQAAAAQDAQIILTFPNTGYALPSEWTGGLESVYEPNIQHRCPAALPPGLIPEGLRPKLALLGYTMPTPCVAPNGVRILAPKYRFAKGPAISDALAAYAVHWDWVGAPFVLNRMPAQRVARYAWEALAARDAEFATRLASQALLHDGDKSFARTTLGTIHIINQAYSELANTNGATETDKINLAWGKTLAGDVSAAIETFKTAEPQNAVLGLYLRNITALAHFRNGNKAEAWKLQHEIQEQLGELVPASPHLSFINNLNMSRLARDEKDYGTAQSLVNAAFDARRPGLSEHDEFYYLVQSASIAQNPVEKNSYWQNADKVFSGQKHPGAIPSRSFRTVVGRAPNKFEPREIAVAAALESRTSL